MKGISIFSCFCFIFTLSICLHAQVDWEKYQGNPIFSDSMENCVDLKTGLQVDIKTGKNWFI